MDSSPEVPPELSAEEFFAVLGSLLEKRRAALRETSVAFEIIEDGPYFVDTRRRPLVGEGFLEDPKATVLCNRRTLADILFGRFDAQHPLAGQLFVWKGEDEAFEILASALEGGQSLLGAHLNSLRHD